MKKVLIVLLGTGLLFAPIQSYAGVGSKQVQYSGGNVSQIPKAAKGNLILADQGLRFEYKNGEYSIPYSSIQDMEYGDHPSTRIGTAIGVGLVCWPCGIATLFVHAKHHFLTLEFTQGATKQAAVFELGKALPQALLPELEVKTGKKVEQQNANSKSTKEKRKSKTNASGNES